MGVKETHVGIYFSVQAISYAVSSLMVAMFSVKVEKRYITMVGLIFAVIAALCIGPCSHLGLPQQPYVVLIGLLMLGLGADVWALDLRLFILLGASCPHDFVTI